MRSFLGGIKNLIAWFPIIWCDRDWDYAFLLKIMSFKLNRMRHCIEKNNVIAHAPDVALEIMQAELMLRNIEEDPDDEWSFHWNVWHHTKDIQEHCGEYFAHQEALGKSQERDERNWHTLWKHLDEKMQGWWD